MQSNKHTAKELQNFTLSSLGLLPAVGNAVFNGLIQQVLVGRHLSSSQDEGRVSGGILRLVLFDGCRMGRPKGLKVTYKHKTFVLFSTDIKRISKYI